MPGVLRYLAGSVLASATADARGYPAREGVMTTNWRSPRLRSMSDLHGSMMGVEGGDMTTPEIPPAGPPAGWYPSQTDPAIELHWDGSAWTGQTRRSPPPAPVAGPPGTREGTGIFQGLFWNGKRWVNPDGTPARISGTPVTTTSAPPTGGRSTGRTIGGVLALIVAAVSGLQAFSWFQGFAELQADGNQFSGMLVPLALGAGAVAAGFGIWGITLLSKK